MDTPPPFDPVRHRRGGRPLLPDGERYSEKLYFRLTLDELDAVKARAEDARQSVSEFARRMVRDGKVKVTYSRHCDPRLWVEVHLMLYKLKDCLNAAEQQGFPPETVEAIKEASREAGAYMRVLMAQGETEANGAGEQAQADDDEEDEHSGEWDDIEP
jgi:hypothetical protein